MSRELIKISNIKISDEFLAHPPNPRKIEYKRKRIERLGRQNKPIVIDENGILTDGYATLCAMKQLGYDEAWYLDQDTYGNYERNCLLTYKNIPTTYISGFHIKDKRRKVYMWRATNAQRDWVYAHILPGDVALVSTKYGAKAVYVTKIETLDKCPTDKRVRKFIKKLYNGV